MSIKRKITSIEIQRRNKKRRSIYLDGEFAFGVEEELVFKFNLHEGDEIEEEQLWQIICTEEKRCARDRALRFLGYRARSEKEVRDKLEDTGSDVSIIDAVIDDLKAVRLIDDRQFVTAFIHDKMMLRPSGPFLLRNELKKHQLDDDIINWALEEAFREKTPLDIAVELIQKRYRTLKKLEWPQARKRLADFLARRGFDWEITSEALQQLEIEINENR